MKRKVIALFLCIVLVCTFCFLAYADSDDSSSDGYSAIISDIPTTCPTCGAALHALWRSTAGAEVELQITEAGKITIPAGAGVYAHFRLCCENCGYSKSETRILGLDWGSEHPGQWEVKQVPSGIGRKDLPGYADDNGTPSVDSSGFLSIVVEPYGVGGDYKEGFTASVPDSSSFISGASASGLKFLSNNEVIVYHFIAPSNGVYFVGSLNGRVNYGYISIFADNDWRQKDIVYSFSDKYKFSKSLNQGDEIYLYIRTGDYHYVNGTKYWPISKPFRYSINPIRIFYEPLADSGITNYNNITINNNTWNGNIYVDDSNSLTYIYPEYTTINENNETVTNISNNPIIYNNETQQYYTYDSTTNNYYYITYVESTPTPSPEPSPSPTPDPGTAPTPIPTPDGGSSGGDGGSGSGGSSGGSGSSWWEKLLDKLGSALIDGLLGAISAVLKLIFKLLSTILGWIIWLVSQVLTLFPFLPPSLGALLIGGVVVCFVIGIIKFIRG